MARRKLHHTKRPLLLILSIAFYSRTLTLLFYKSDATIEANLSTLLFHQNKQISRILPQNILLGFKKCKDGKFLFGFSLRSEDWYIRHLKSSVHKALHKLLYLTTALYPVQMDERFLLVLYTQLIYVHTLLT